MNTSEPTKSAIEIIEELAAARNAEEAEKRRLSQEKAAAELAERTALWKPCTDIVAEVVAKHPDMVTFEPSREQRVFRRYRRAYGHDDRHELAQSAGRFVLRTEYKIVASGSSPSDLIPALIQVLADFIR